MDYTSFSGLTDICYLNFLHHVCEIEMVKLHTISVMFIKNDFHLHIHIMRKLGMNDEASGEINDQAFINRTICQAWFVFLEAQNKEWDDFKCLSCNRGFIRFLS